jgi:hypothetical protein
LGPAAHPTMRANTRSVWALAVENGISNRDRPRPPMA